MQAKPEYLDQLIERASKAAGNDSKLAKALHVSRGNVSDWRVGRRPCPAAAVVLMAEMAGLEPEKWAARALIGQYEGTPTGDNLYRALGKALLVTGAAAASSGASAAVIFSESVGYFIRCIERLSRNDHSAHPQHA